MTNLTQGAIDEQHCPGLHVCSSYRIAHDPGFCDWYRDAHALASMYGIWSSSGADNEGVLEGRAPSAEGMKNA